MKPIPIIAVAALLSGCGTLSQLNAYDTGRATADAQIEVQGRRMNLWFHRTEPQVLAGLTVADAAGGGAIRGLTFGLAEGFKPDPRAIDTALAAFLAPTGCRADPVRQIGGQSINFDARYSCPDGVDLRAMVIAQSSSLMRGEPIRTP